jgi:hypothetical protein
MGTLRSVSGGGVDQIVYLHEQNAHDISLKQRLSVVLSTTDLEIAGMREVVDLRLQPYSSGSYVSMNNARRAMPLTRM